MSAITNVRYYEIYTISTMEYRLFGLALESKFSCKLIDTLKDLLQTARNKYEEQRNCWHQLVLDRLKMENYPIQYAQKLTGAVEGTKTFQEDDNSRFGIVYRLQVIEDIFQHHCHKWKNHRSHEPGKLTRFELSCLIPVFRELRRGPGWDCYGNKNNVFQEVVLGEIEQVITLQYKPCDSRTATPSWLPLERMEKVLDLISIGRERWGFG